MKIVIDIPEKWYRWAKFNNIENGSMVSRGILDAVGIGTPLPKGHGRLIDADEVKRKMGNLDGVGMIGRCIDEFTTIVEADTESEDKNEIIYT